MKLFDKTDLNLFLFFLLFLIIYLCTAWLITDNKKSDPLAVQTTNYINIKNVTPHDYRPASVPRFICPVKPHWNRCLTSPYGLRESPTSGELQDHRAIDISGGPRCEILSSADGTVYDAGLNPVDGYYIIIIHAGGYRTKYSHLSSVYVKAGQVVTISHVIGRMGKTGMATGEHLHFEVWFMGVALDGESVLKLNPDSEMYF